MVTHHLDRYIKTNMKLTNFGQGGFQAQPLKRIFIISNIHTENIIQQTYHMVPQLHSEACIINFSLTLKMVYCPINDMI